MNATVKRKFNALLQGIGNSSDTSNKRPSSSDGRNDNDALRSLNSSPASSSALSSRMSSSDYLSKKRRVGAAPPIGVGSTSSLTTTPSKGFTTISNVTLRKWTPTGSVADGDGGAEEPPKYCPGDREQLLRRLATFQELTDWTPKPEAVNEVEWAKRGWVCHGKERVRCTLCEREIVVKVNKKEVDGKEIAVMIASEIAQSVVDMYREMIVTSHADDCLWRRRGCDDSLLRLPLPNPKVAFQNLRQRYDELCGRKDFLPYEFNLRLPETLDLDTILTYLPPNFFTEPLPSFANKPPPATTTTTTPDPPPPPNRSALGLALLGWQGLSNSRMGGAVPNSASCHTCLRRLGLWMFKSKEVDPETNQVLVPAPMDHLDPLREHRFFCPWKNGKAQRNSGAKPNTAAEGADKPGWEILVQVLRNEAFIRQRVGPPAGAGASVHGRSKSSVPATGMGSTTPCPQGGRTRDLLAMRTPDRRPMTSDGRPGDVLTPPGLLASPGGLSVAGHDHDDDGGEEDDEETKKKKDQAMMSRLRRVKSLFNTKAGSKLKRLGSSRPGTAHSTASRASNKAGE